VAAIPELLGLSISEGIAFALGLAMGPALEPLTQEIKNESWSSVVSRSKGDISKPLEVGDLAAIVAESVEALNWGRTEARKTGIRQEDFDALFHAEQDAPGFGTLLQLLRRGLIDAADFEHGLRKAKLEGRWDAGLEALRDDRLAPAQVALGIVRSLLKDPGFLPVTLNTSGGQVPAYGVSPLDPVAEAEAHGVTRERLRVLVGEIGLPMPLESAASSVFRGIIERADFNRAVLEGDTRPEWADAIFEHARQIPAVSDYVNAHIRGWISEAEMHAGAARHGMSHADVDLLYLRTGRPAAPGQMATAAARGIDGPDKRPMDRAQFLKGIAESDIRPEWGPMLWDARYLYPPLFQITRLVQADAITPETARDWAVKDRYPPEVVGPLYDYWTQPATAKADTHAAKAQTQLWGTLHRAYMAGDVTDAVATEKLGQAGVPSGSVAAVLGTWKHEREIQRQRITPAQLKKAVAKAVTNPATGAPWSKDEALAELLSRGWSSQDANTFLDTPTGK
jgi:hypothetical protein